MSLLIRLSPEAEGRLLREAGRAGLDASEYACRLIEKHLTTNRSADSTLSLLAAWDTEDATEDPKELEVRRREWEDFKRALNESHSSPREIYPC
jgi:hypothetical protein